VTSVPNLSQGPQVAALFHCPQAHVLSATATVVILWPRTEKTRKRTWARTTHHACASCTTGRCGCWSRSQVRPLIPATRCWVCVATTSTVAQLTASSGTSVCIAAPQRSLRRARTQGRIAYDGTPHTEGQPLPPSLLADCCEPLLSVWSAVRMHACMSVCAQSCMHAFTIA
jgi:hypothetical protein